MKNSGTKVDKAIFGLLEKFFRSCKKVSQSILGLSIQYSVIVKGVCIWDKCYQINGKSI